MLARGDAVAGALLLIARERDGSEQLLERSPAQAGASRWEPVGPAGDAERTAYLARRRRTDPDLWLLEIEGCPGLPALLAPLTGLS